MLVSELPRITTPEGYYRPVSGRLNLFVCDGYKTCLIFKSGTGATERTVDLTADQLDWTLERLIGWFDEQETTFALGRALAKETLGW
jgi:hypothetical protein